jgi:ataxia telangiectasia mutated family protein
MAGSLCGGSLMAPTVSILRAPRTVEVSKSGLSLPKIATLVGSDGRVYKQVVKPDADMRQDELMQTYLSACNLLFASAPSARRRGLAIRTYRIVPVSKRSGVIEFVQGAVPMLQPISTLHRRYRPYDLDPVFATKRMAEAEGMPLSVRREVLHRIFSCGIRPAFHWFFLERFPHPEAAAQRRAAFASTLATASAVGHIVGLGDRHLSNLMIDPATAEIVHIDFGVCFESGHLLRTPERVPFRLTRDIVAGLGAVGVDGAFHGGLTAALEVVRGAPETPLAVIGVLLDDPLCKWIVSEQQRAAWQRRVEEAAQEAMGQGYQPAGRAATLGSRSGTASVGDARTSRSVSVAAGTRRSAAHDGEDGSSASDEGPIVLDDASDDATASGADIAGQGAHSHRADGHGSPAGPDLAPETRRAGEAHKRAEELGGMAETGMGGDRPAQAKSTLQRCKDKLRGAESDSAAVLNPSQQCDLLIAQATDMDRLASIYRGWQAWL